MPYACPCPMTSLPRAAETPGWPHFWWRRGSGRFSCKLLATKKNFVSYEDGGFDRLFWLLHIMQPARRVHEGCQNFMQTLKALVKPSPSHARALMPLGDLGHNGIGKHRRWTSVFIHNSRRGWVTGNCDVVNSNACCTCISIAYAALLGYTPMHSAQNLCESSNYTSRRSRNLWHMHAYKNSVFFPILK